MGCGLNAINPFFVICGTFVAVVLSSVFVMGISSSREEMLFAWRQGDYGGASGLGEAFEAQDDLCCLQEGFYPELLALCQNPVVRAYARRVYQSGRTEFAMGELKSMRRLVAEDAKDARETAIGVKIDEAHVRLASLLGI